MTTSQKEPCPVCETKKQLSAMEMTPELLEEMAEGEHYADGIDEEHYRLRLSICNSCKDLQQGMTCGHCGCFVQFRAKHSTAHCAMGKW